jgi:hypothetical protein
MWTVFNNISHYCATTPRLDIAHIKGKNHGQLILETRAYPVFNVLHDLFIINGRKSIKEELFFYVRPIALAYWIMSDGVANQYGMTICTNSFTVKK